MTPPDQTARQRWLALLAKAPPARLAALLPELPAHQQLRAPEVGAVMVRGRVGGTAEPFNLGEMTVTRASVQLADGAVGHAWVQGRDKTHATRAAVLDALLQSDGTHNALIDTLAVEAEARRSARSARAAATKVDFFTMVRGEDQ
jgi:alpha-D-ribose 1-methylphosphonate 5-triphosphate synthase subunit PhnG